MNIFLNIFTFIPAMISYLRGNRLFHEGNYNGAIKEFEKCLKHPKFQNELSFSSYGQALCASGRSVDGLEYLLKACQAYEENLWVFENEFTNNLAENTLDALKHVTEASGSEAGKSYLSKKLQLKNK